MYSNKKLRQVARIIKDSKNKEELAIQLANFYQLDFTPFKRKEFLKIAGVKDDKDT